MLLLCFFSIFTGLARVWLALSLSLNTIHSFPEQGVQEAGNNFPKAAFRMNASCLPFRIKARLGDGTEITWNNQRHEEVLGVDSTRNWV